MYAFPKDVGKMLNKKCKGGKVMNKKGLIDYVANETGLTKKDVRVVIGAVLDGIKEGLREDGKVGLVGFGTFTSVWRDARTARNPQTGEPVDVPAKYVPKFRPSQALRNAINPTVQDE